MGLCGPTRHGLKQLPCFTGAGPQFVSVGSWWGGDFIEAYLAPHTVSAGEGEEAPSKRGSGMLGADDANPQDQPSEFGGGPCIITGRGRDVSARQGCGGMSGNELHTCGTLAQTH